MLKDIWLLMVILGFFCLFLSIVLFFIWKVPNLIDELSGRKARRQIEMIRGINSNSGSGGKFSTNELYMGISSGLLSVEDSSNIKIDKIITEVSIEENIEEVVTSDLSEEKTSYLPDEMETSFIDVADKKDDDVSVVVLEELSSL